MDKLDKFLRFKAVDILLFIVFMIFVWSGAIFDVDKSYTVYLSLIAISLFVIYMIISFVKLNKFIEEATKWAHDPATRPPSIIGGTSLEKQISKTFIDNKSYSNELKLKEKHLLDYVTIWTHQIKTPIFSLNLLLDEEPVDTLAAKASVFEIEEYLNNLLSYIRLEADNTDYIFEEVDIDEIIRSTIRKYSKLLIRRQNKIDFSPTNLKVTTDKKWLGFILDQIISNANKYTKEGTISFYIEGDCLVIADTGIGIRPEDVPRVFDRSFTGYNGRVYKKSTGLGLSLVKMVAENLNIGVSLSSEVDLGTKVYIDFSNLN